MDEPATPTSWDAIVLAGGRSARLDGVDKAGLRVGDRDLLGLTLDAVAAADRVVVVGERPALASRGVVVVREDPPLGGPAAGIGAGMAEVTAATVIVLACDMPRVGEVVPLLLDAHRTRGGNGAVAIDGGRAQHLAIAVDTSTLRERMRAASPLHGTSVRALLADLDLAPVEVPPGSTHDVDSWHDAAAQGVTR
jgi:molybdopterin-guanine dinucleotide biosynthesis protein A